MTKEKSILFSTDMVSAILDERKSMTRRIIKWPSTPDWHDFDYDPNILVAPSGTKDWWPRHIVRGWNGKKDVDTDMPLKCPYGEVGDVLYVRETWARFAGPQPSDPNSITYTYLADKPDRKYAATQFSNDAKNVPSWAKWKPSIHMPKQGSRIWLEVVSVRVEHLKDISQEDARAEGISAQPHRPASEGCKAHSDNSLKRDCYCCAFKVLWNIINGEKASWDSNPWVWVIEFKVLSTTGKPDSIPADERSIATKLDQGKES